MTGRTHDMAAFTTLVGVMAFFPMPSITLSTAIVSLGANMLGGDMPDIDQPTGVIWHKLPLGTWYSRLFTPFLGGHRYISHSRVGIFLFGYLSWWGLTLISHVLLVDIKVVWDCFMIGFLSHLVMDTITREGVPWFFPIPIRIGIPPMKAFRVATGGLIERFLIFPGLIVMTGYIVYSFHSKFILLLHHYIR